MRTSTFNYIKDILADFYKTDEYIRQRKKNYGTLIKKQI